MPAREGPENGKAEAQPVFSISGGAFSDLLKGHQSLEDPKTHQVAQWWWRFFGSRGKKTNRGLRFERFSTERRFAEVPQVRYRGSCQLWLRSRAGSGCNVVKAVRRQSAFTWVFGMPHSKACICMRPQERETSGLASDFVHFAAR